MKHCGELIAYLLNRSDMPSDIFDRNWVLDSETMALTFYPRLVNEHSSISSKAYG